jgi:oligo-1,6-glucosidase
VSDGTADFRDRDPQWWRSGVLYQVWPRSFSDSDGDGRGDLRGVLQRLDHLADLGVDAVWLSPFYPSPFEDGGYDVADYCDVDPSFGTLGDFDDLVTAAHRRGLRVLVDLVANHTSREHRWFLESRSSRDSPLRSWYYWRPPRPGTVGGEPGAEPNDWESRFGGSAWEWDPATGEYYLHLYDVSQPDLNWANPDVRRAVRDVVRFWLDRGVDGFRMDVITKIDKTDGLPDVGLLPGQRWADASIHYLDRPRVHDYLKELRREVLDRHQPRPVTIGEAWAVPVDTARGYTDPAAGELDAVISFDHVLIDRTDDVADGAARFPRTLLDTVVRWQRGLGGVGWSAVYWGSHDQPRALSRFGDPDPRFRRDSAAALITVQMCLQGPVLLYQGEEIGMADPPHWSLDDLRDVAALRRYSLAVQDGGDPATVLARVGRAGRDNARTPMRWDDSPGAGFTTGTAWIRDSGDPPDVSVQAQRGVPGSVLEFVKRAIAFRHAEPALRDGAFDEVLPGHPTVFAFTRSLPDRQILVLAQWASEPVECTLPDPTWATATVALATTDDPARVGDDGTVVLRPWEALVLTRNVSD